MTTRSWIRKRFARPVAQPLRTRPHRARLAVEALEQRWVPSFTVTNLLDDGSVGSLRWAVGQANATGGDERIDFDPTVFATPRTITLSGTQLELTDTTGTETLTGPAVGVTVAGGGLSSVFQIDRGVSASISGLTISGGRATGYAGGGLANLGGTLTLTGCTVSGNSALAGGGLNNTGTLSLTNCTVSGNSASGYYYDGGGISNTGTLSLTNCTVSGNSARDGAGLENLGLGNMTVTNCSISDNSGRGIENRDMATLTNCTISGNSAGGLLSEGWGGMTTLTDCTVSGNFSLGGLFDFFSNLTLINCTVSGNSANSAGGLYNAGGRLTLTNCTVSYNSAGYFGGGVLASRGSTTTLTNCTIKNNAAFSGGGGVLASRGSTTTLTNCTISGNTSLGPGGSGGGLQLEFGTTTVTGCTITGNSVAFNGGGVANYGDNTTLTNCTISGNSSSGTGGGVADGVGFGNSTTTLNNCTISGNSATTNGGGVSTLVNCTTTLTNCTVSGNSVVGQSARGGGIFNGGTCSMTNTILATNTATTAPDISGRLGSHGHNLVGNTTGGSGFDTTDLLNLDPLLGPLQDNGGTTLTTALLAGSPALNAGDPTQLGVADQRGVVRTGGVNIGAYQASASAFVLTAPDTVTAGMPFDVTVTAVDVFAQVAVGYTGTVMFSTTDPDPNVVLPPDYPFTLADQGMHTFMAGFTLQTPGLWTLTATDTAGGFASSVPITVTSGPGGGGRQSPNAPPPRHDFAVVDRFFAALPGDPGFLRLAGTASRGEDPSPALLWAARHGDRLIRKDDCFECWNCGEVLSADRNVYW